MSLELPDLCASRASANDLLKTNRDKSVVVDASNVKSATQGYVDELCKGFIQQNVDRVTFLNPTERIKEHFMRAHWLRSAKFLVEFR